MRISRKARRILLVALGVPVFAYLVVFLMAPEVGKDPGTGVALLNVRGAGYKLGDVVWLSAKPRSFKAGDVVLVDWRQAQELPLEWRRLEELGPGSGWGPTCALRRVIAAPGDTVEISPQLTGGATVTVGDTKIHNCYFDAGDLLRIGFSYDRRLTLGDGLHLLLKDTGPSVMITPARQEYIKARVCFKVGHDPFRASALRSRGY